MSDPTLDEVRRWLGLLPELCALLPDAAVTTGGAGIATGPSLPGSRPPTNLEVLHLLDTREKWNWEWGMWQVNPNREGVLPYLHGWVRDLEATAIEEGLTPTEWAGAEYVTTCCDWLLRNLELAAQLPQWPHFARGIRAVYRQLVAAVSRVRDTGRVPVPCQHCGHGTLARDAGSNRWTCSACGHIVTVQAVTLRQAAKLIGVAYQTLWEWAQRPGVLSPILADTGTRRLYDLNDVRRLVAEERVRKALKKKA